MSFGTRFLQSTIGLKFLMAFSGLAMVLFLVAHLAGNLLFFAGEEAINDYARNLRHLGPLLWLARAGLLLVVVVHFYSGVTLILRGKAARHQNYVSPSYMKTTLYARTMAISGMLILVFICYHLAHFTFRWTHPELFASLGEYDVHQMIRLSFSSPVVSTFYVFSITALMFHLNHGVSSFCQTLGLNHKHYNVYIKRSGLIISIVLACGFLSLPISVVLGLVN